MTKQTLNSSDHSNRVLRALRCIMREIDLHSRKLIKNHQITTPQLICLLEIANNGPITTASIAKSVNLSPSTIVGILDRLEDKGLVLRERSTKDRRQVFNSATKKGLQWIKTAPSPLQDKLVNALDQLSELEQATISLALERIVNLMGAEDISAGCILDAGPINPE